MVEQNLLTIYKNRVSISCYSEFHAIAGNLQTTKELLTVASELYIYGRITPAQKV